jgi:hypothetical protein
MGLYRIFLAGILEISASSICRVFEFSPNEWSFASHSIEKGSVIHPVAALPFFRASPKAE